MGLLKKGDRVRMTAALKAKRRGKCLPGKHVGPFVEDMPNEGCLHCSTDHIEEFGECIGIVAGPMDLNNVPVGDPTYDPTHVGPWVDVRWQPSNLRYAYLPDELERVGENFESSEVVVAPVRVDVADVEHPPEVLTDEAELLRRADHGEPR